MRGWNMSVAVATLALTLLLPLSSLAQAECPNPATMGGANAMMVALLPLHRGPACSTIRLRSLQQMAAARTALMEINSEYNGDGLVMGLQVMDTCSDTKHAIRMGFKALMFSDTSTCKKSPFFLGFLGPDEGEILDAVQKVTSVFHLSHVTPLSLPGHQLEIPNPFHVVTVKPAEKIRSILQLVKHLRWTALSIVHSPDSESTMLTSSLVTAAHSNGPCVAVVRPLPGEGVDAPSLLSELPTSGILVISTPERLVDVLNYAKASTEPHTFIFVTDEAGILPGLALTTDLSSSVLVMQEVSPTLPGLDKQLMKSPMWEEYLYQVRCNFSSCSNNDMSVVDHALVQDPSVLPLAQAIRLYSSALRSAHRLKCMGRPGQCSALNNLDAEEWRGILGSATEKGVRFQMDKPSTYKIFYKYPLSQKLEKVGTIKDGGRQIQVADFQMLESHYALCKDNAALTNNFSPASGSSGEMTYSPTFNTYGPVVIKNVDDLDLDEHDVPSATTKPYESSDIDIFDLSKYSFVEFVCIMVGVGCGIAFIFFVIICAVYKNFRVKGEERSKGGSSPRGSIRSN